MGYCYTRPDEYCDKTTTKYIMDHVHKYCEKTAGFKRLQTVDVTV